MVRISTTTLASMLLPASCQNRSLGSVGSFVARSSCSWHVVDQTITVEAPVLIDVDVGFHCPKHLKGTMHDDICAQCGVADNQCGGEFVACAGCCDLPKKEARYHSCDNIKKYFFEKNTKSVACDARMDLGDGDVHVEMGPETTQRENSGTLTAGCDVPAIQADAEGVPVKLQFDCTGCATRGVPELLQKCCAKAEGFQDSVMIRKLRQDGFTVFVWADGCHDRWIGDGSIEFPHSYPELTEEAIDREMDAFVETKYCSVRRKPGSDNCNRRLRDSSSVESNVSHSRRLNDADCPWLAKPYTVSQSRTGTESSVATGAAAVDSNAQGFEASNGAAGLSSPLAAMLVGGGVAFFSS